jgi:hypothetical protein
MFLQKPARELLENQIDFDILPSDLFADMKSFNASFDGSLNVNGESYRVLVVPYAEFISSALAKFARKASAAGFEVIFIDALPTGIYDGNHGKNDEDSMDLIAGLSRCAVIPLKELARCLKSKSIHEISLSSPFERLRYYHYKKYGQDAYMFFNEHPGQTFEGEITVAASGPSFIYDAMENEIRPASCEPCGIGSKLHLRLEPYESAVIIFGQAPADLKAAPAAVGTAHTLTGEWKLSFSESKSYPSFSGERKIGRLESIGKLLPDFSGFIRYEKDFDLMPEKTAVLEIEDAYEGVEVWMNGRYAGMKICPPYRFDISELVIEGRNSLRIEVANTLDRAVRSMVPNSMMHVMRGKSFVSPSGIVGDVSVYVK